MSSALTEDMLDLLRLLNEHGVEFLVCGGHAVGFHGYPRLTMDFDLLINPTTENAARLRVAIVEFGFGEAGIDFEVFARGGAAVSLGAQPNQIDLLTSVDERPAAEIFRRAVPGELDGVQVMFISIEDLIDAKKAAARPKDLADLDELEKFCKPLRGQGGNPQLLMTQQKEGMKANDGKRSEDICSRS